MALRKKIQKEGGVEPSELEEQVAQVGAMQGAKLAALQLLARPAEPGERGAHPGRTRGAEHRGGEAPLQPATALRRRTAAGGGGRQQVERQLQLWILAWGNAAVAAAMQACNGVDGCSSRLHPACSACAPPYPSAVHGCSAAAISRAAANRPQAGMRAFHCQRAGRSCNIAGCSSCSRRRSHRAISVPGQQRVVGCCRRCRSPSTPPAFFSSCSPQALFDLEATNQELKGDLRDLWIAGATEVDVSAARKAILIKVRLLRLDFCPFALLPFCPTRMSESGLAWCGHALPFCRRCRRCTTCARAVLRQLLTCMLVYCLCTALQVPYRLLKAYHKVQQRLVRELEKKFSGEFS